MGRKVLWVEWVDSTGRDGWQEADQDTGISDCLSVGFLHRETENSITLVQSYADVGSWVGNITIPKVAIIRQHRLPTHTKRKKR